MHAARSLISAVPVALALAVPATAVAAPADLVAHASAATTIKLNSVTSPPRAATAGQRFTLKGTVTNRRTTSQRATVQVSLRRTKTAYADSRRYQDANADPRRTLRRLLD